MLIMTSVSQEKVSKKPAKEILKAVWKKENGKLICRWIVV